MLEAEPITADEAAKLARRRQLEPSERASLARFRLAERWGLGAADPIPPGKKGKPPPLLLADRDGLADRLRLIFHIYALRRGLIPRLGGGE